MEIGRTKVDRASRIIRAKYTDSTITVYQAYSKEIGNVAAQENTFRPPFRMERMTWIKPSFLWMMYRSNWATKFNQQCVLAVEISREGFEWALSNSCISHFDARIHESRGEWREILEESPVRIQWDPDRGIDLQPKWQRAIQVGLSGAAVERYVNEWIVHISDVTEYVREIREVIATGDAKTASAMLPVEIPYPISGSICRRIGADMY